MHKPVDCPVPFQALVERGRWVQTRESYFMPNGIGVLEVHIREYRVSVPGAGQQYVDWVVTIPRTA